MKFLPTKAMNMSCWNPLRFRSIFSDLRNSLRTLRDKQVIETVWKKVPRLMMTEVIAFLYLLDSGIKYPPQARLIQALSLQELSPRNLPNSPQILPNLPERSPFPNLQMRKRTKNVPVRDAWLN